MSASPDSESSRRPHTIISTRGGVTRVFHSVEELREHAREPLPEEEQEKRVEAFRLLDELDAMILERTGGRGITEEDLEDALRAAKDH